MARDVTNMTITIPLELKEEMNSFSQNYPETNWSLVARKGIQQYIEAHRGTAPQVRISLDGTELKIDSQSGPSLMTRLFFENRMPTEIIIDRWAINQTVLSGIDLFLASRATSWNMNPIRL